MVQLKRYERQKAIDYARAWALGRNPVYHDYEKYGGDCTNYISQCLHAGNIPFDESGRDVTMKWYWYSIIHGHPLGRRSHLRPIY